MKMAMKTAMYFHKFAMPDPTTSVPGILSLQNKSLTQSSKQLDVKFYTTPNTPPSETGPRPYCPNETYNTKLRDQEALATDLMKELIKDYETNYRASQFSRMDALEHDRRTRKLSTLIKLCGPKIPHCEKEKDPRSFAKSDVDFHDDGDIIGPAYRDDYWMKIFDRPSTTVTQSAFVAALEAEVNAEIKRCGCPPPVYKINRLYDDLRRGQIGMDTMMDPELGVDDYVSVRDSMDEPEERLLARFKIYKPALSSLILHFKSLRPILIPIKRNYDGLLGLRDRQMHDIHLIKSNLGYTERCYDVRMAEVNAEGYYQLCEAEKKCFLLLRHIDKQDAAMRTMTEILNNLENSLEEEVSLKMSSEDKRKKLIIEINDLRRQINESARILGQDAALQAAAAAAVAEEKSSEEDLNSVNDSTILRSALENIRKNLSEAQYRLTILEADYSDVIPKSEFEILETRMKEEEKQYKTVQDDYDTLFSQVSELKEQVDTLIAERDDFQELVINLKFKATPRPSWSKIAEFVGGMNKWQEIYQGKSSKQIVDVVVEILTGKKTTSPPDMIQPLGTSDSVPPYLRHDEPIRHRHFTRRETAILVHDIVQFRIDQIENIRKLRETVDDDDYGAKDQQLLPNTVDSFPEYVTKYFSERFPWPNLRAEWTYNLLDGCRRFPHEYTLTKFLGILEGRIDEALVHLLRSDIGRVRNILIEKSKLGNHPMGSITAAEFAGAMREAFPQKTDLEIKSLVKAASTQTGTVADWYLMKYVSFFIMTDEGLVGEFIDEVIKQYDADRLEYVYEILNVLLSELGVSLQSAEREDDPAGETDVSISQIYTAITTVDPLLPEEKLAASLSWIFVGESTLPGMPPRGLLLVRYIQENSRRNPNEDSDHEDVGDDGEFERAIEEIRNRGDSSMLDNDTEIVNEKKRKAMIKKLKVVPLRTIIMRLKGGCLFRFGKKESVENSIPPSDDATAKPLINNINSSKGQTKKPTIVTTKTRAETRRS